MQTHFRPYCLYLPPPTSLAGAPPARSPVIRSVAEQFLELTPVAPSQSADRDLDALMRSLDAYLAGLTSIASTGFNEKQRLYDSHFHIIRAGDNALDLLVAGTITAFHSFLNDQRQGNSLQPVEIAHLFSAAQLIVELLIQEETQR